MKYIYYFTILLLAFSVTLIAFLWLGDGLCNLKYLIIESSPSSTIGDGQVDVEGNPLSDNTEASSESYSGALRDLDEQGERDYIKVEPNEMIGLSEYKIKDEDCFDLGHNTSVKCGEFMDENTFAGTYTAEWGDKYTLIENARVTAYTSDPLETDDTPCENAWGWNICNLHKAGLRIIACPIEYEPDSLVEVKGIIYSCMDRMNQEKHPNDFDIYFGFDKQGALEFGVKYLNVRVIK